MDLLPVAAVGMESARGSSPSNSASVSLGFVSV